MTNIHNDERFYGKDNWLVTNDKTNESKIYLKTPIMDIIEKLPRNTKSRYLFQRVKKSEVREEPIVSEEGDVEVQIENLQLNETVHDYFSRRYGSLKVINDNTLLINVSDNKLADNAKEKLSKEEYDSLVAQILLENSK